MSDSASGETIEVVRGRLSDQRAEELLHFWSSTGALVGEAARRRLSQVVCVLLNGDGAIAGVNSVHPDDVSLVGGRTFWLYRSFLRTGTATGARMMVSAAFAELQKEFDAGAAGPVGLCLLVEDRAEIERRPEVEWPDPRLLYAGYLADGRQVRIGYFAGAKIAVGRAPAREAVRPLDDGYRIELFADQEAISAQTVIDLWAREGVVVPEEARRRVPEVLLVAIHEDGELAGVSSVYLQENPQLRLDLWHFRAFVASGHRRSNVAVNLAVRGRDHLQDLFATGRDLRAAGIVYEVESEVLKRSHNEAVWSETDFTFIGENAKGDHVRVHYFPGALAPPPL